MPELRHCNDCGYEWLPAPKRNPDRPDTCPRCRRQLIKGGPGYPRGGSIRLAKKENPWSEADIAKSIAEIAQADVAKLRGEIREMREEYRQLVNLIAEQIAGKLIKAMQSIEIEIPKSIEHHEPDELNIEDLLLPESKAIIKRH